MEYLFLRRKKTRYTSVRQKTLLYRAASRRWEKEFALRTDVRRIDALIYKGILYLMEVRQVFLDSSLSLKTLSAMLETNQTYLSNVVNRYFGCNLKELVNTYRVEYAKELLRSGRCPIAGANVIEARGDLVAFARAQRACISTQDASTKSAAGVPVAKCDRRVAGLIVLVVLRNRSNEARTCGK